MGGGKKCIILCLLLLSSKLTVNCTNKLNTNYFNIQILNKNQKNFFTCRSWSFSLFLIQDFPWPWGSINSGYLVAFVVMIPFWIDSSSFGRPWMFHSPICWTYPKIFFVLFNFFLISNLAMNQFQINNITYSSIVHKHGYQIQITGKWYLSLTQFFLPVRN